MFQQYAAMEKEGRERYEKAYGPISRPSSANGTEYTWINNPWPWDYQEGK
jgi:spore coat protein JB